MPEYRCSHFPGGYFFFTVVTFNRKPILIQEQAIDLLREAWLITQSRFPFITEAVCILPNHLHCIWHLPDGDADFSVRWKELKRRFTMNYLQIIGPVEGRNLSRIKHGEASIWQRRFWEHTIRDQEDLNRHVDYIHFNPVKHRLVRQPVDWEWSSFHRYVKDGF